jgi:CheY-like chemotaxis protein
MKSVNRQSILIVEPIGQIRDEIFNFLLSAGYEKTEEADGLESALEKIQQSAYDVIVADAGAPSVAGLQFATYLAQLSPGAMIILMIEADERQLWDQIATQSREVRFLIKTDFARNLLYLLEENTQP